jgi:hypothetical protein
MGHMLSLRKRLESLLRRRDLAKPPIILDFTQKKAYRADEAELTEDLRPRLSKRRVVKTVEGIPPQAVPQPKT